MIVQTGLNVYSSIPLELLRIGSKDHLRAYLSQNRDVWFKSSKLARESGFRVRSGQIEVRKALTELLLSGCPIVASGKGFKWTTNQLDIQIYLDALDIRLQGLERRIVAVRNLVKYEEV